MTINKPIIAFLKDRIIGQDHACESIADSVEEAQMGLNDPDMAMGSFLLLGSTGTGKTAIVRALAEYLYPDNSHRLAIINMADFQLQESVNILRGRNKDEQGLLGDIIDELNTMGGGILLFDEIEKANQALCTLLLAILDTGFIQMANGVIKYVNNIFLFFTSNLGSAKIAQLKHSTQWLFDRIIKKAAEAFFKPEGYARFDTVIIFNSLSFETQRSILLAMIDKHCSFIEKKYNIKIEIDELSVVPFCIRNGFHPTLGARPLKRAIRKFLNKALIFDLKNQSSLKYKIEADDYQLIAIRR